MAIEQNEVISPSGSMYDELAAAYAATLELQRRVFGQTWPRDKDDLIQRYCMYVAGEAHEALRETSFKQHRPAKDLRDPDQLAPLQEEWADIMIFWMAGAGVLFEDLDEALAAVVSKVRKNKTRSDWEINR